MKIEKLNDNQIRCTLTQADLEARQIKLSELAYGSEKANALFKEMVQQATRECGFEVNDIPLMVEAIPGGGGNLVLVISKVEYPEELDARFSRFSEPGEEYRDEEDPFSDLISSQGASDILNLFEQMKEDIDQNSEDRKTTGADGSESARSYGETEKNTEAAAEEKNFAEAKAKEAVKLNANADIVSVFEFDHMERIERLALVLRDIYHGQNDLYKMEKGRGGYFLLMHKNDHTPEQFNKICNISSEYGRQQAFVPAKGAYFEEHSSLIRGKDALQLVAEVLS